MGKVLFSKEQRTEQIRALLEEGKDFYQIGQELGITQATVRNYAYAIWKEDKLESAKPEQVKRDMAYMNDFKWMWPLACNRIMSACGKGTQAVPQHSKIAEKKFWKS